VATTQTQSALPHGSATGTGSPTNTGPRAEHTLAIVASFIDAYNQGDVEGVLSQLDDHFSYDDCDYQRQRFIDIHGDQAALRAWLAERFAEQDRLRVLTVEIAGPFSSSPNDPRVVGVEVLRTNAALQALYPAPLPVGIKIILNPSGSRIAVLAIESYERCTIFPATPTPVPRGARRHVPRRTAESQRAV
jgi:hypothetical protein